jgi:Icc-related predicted phosphoesterase
MRIVVISDTHTKHHGVELPEGDVLVHCGDFCSKGRSYEAQDFNIWLGTNSYKFKEIVVIPGNHDLIMEAMYLNELDDPKEIFTNAHLLIDEEIEIDGVKFWGSPWTPTFFDWAFMLEGPERSEKWKLIPDNTDVLITHGPPRGILDECPDIYDRSRMVNVGCSFLVSEILNRVNPALHLFGHIHEGYGQKRVGETTFINASTCNRYYDPTNPIKVIDIKP